MAAMRGPSLRHEGAAPVTAARRPGSKRTVTAIAATGIALGVVVVSASGCVSRRVAAVALYDFAARATSSGSLWFRRASECSIALAVFGTEQYTGSCTVPADSVGWGSIYFAGTTGLSILRLKPGEIRGSAQVTSGSGGALNCEFVVGRPGRDLFGEGLCRDAAGSAYLLTFSTREDPVVGLTRQPHVPGSPAPRP